MLVVAAPGIELRSAVADIGAIDLVMMVPATGGAMRAFVVGLGPACRLGIERRLRWRVAVAIPIAGSQADGAARGR